jgi:hypothetical protein
VSGAELRALTDRIADLFDDAAVLVGQDHPVSAAIRTAMCRCADAAIAADREARTAGTRAAVETYLERQAKR